MSKRNVKQKGFSLIELMVSLVIGLILVAAITQVFVGSKVTYSMQSGLSKIQENGRFAMAFLARDLRQAGFSGCTSQSSIANTLRDASGALPDYLDFSASIGGVDNSSSLSYGTRIVEDGTDVVEVRYADTSGGCDLQVGKHNTNSATLHCQANHTFQKGDILIVTDCTTTAIFQQSNVNNNNTVHTIVHNTGNGTDIGNCTNFLGAPVNCPTGSKYQFNTGSVLKMTFYRYFIANNLLGEPALYRQSVANISGVTGTSADELVEGIENMQILYGEDTSGNGTADYYVPFDEVSDAEDIISVRVSIVVRSIEENLVKGTQSLSFNGSTVNYTDGRLRKVFTSTIALRNRL